MCCKCFRTSRLPSTSYSAGASFQYSVKGSPSSNVSMSERNRSDCRTDRCAHCISIGLKNLLTSRIRFFFLKVVAQERWTTTSINAKQSQKLYTGRKDFELQACCAQALDRARLTPLEALSWNFELLVLSCRSAAASVFFVELIVEKSALPSLYTDRPASVFMCSVRAADTQCLFDF